MHDDGTVRIFNADCRAVLPMLDPVDAVVCDPPYGLGFMGQGWDHGVPGIEFWKHVIHAMKPGAHLLAFGGTRTFHRLTCAIEDAGFEIRDCIMWVHAQGFPKSLDVGKAIDKAAGANRTVLSEQPAYGIGGNAAFNGHAEGAVAQITAPATDAAKQWSGWGTALKPAWEPIIVARKPLIGTVSENVLKHGTGGINVDGCRVATGEQWNGRELPNASNGVTWGGELNKRTSSSHVSGRFPANLIHDGSAEVEAGFPVTKDGVAVGVNASAGLVYGSGKGLISGPKGNKCSGYGGSGSASRFYYCAKASKRDRGEGNTHSCVKPQSLMRYLCRLVTPPGGVVLDPFMGSGSTLVAARDEGFRAIGIDDEANYCEIASGRVTGSVEAQTALPLASTERNEANQGTA